jgi:hypothetical protein
MATTSRQNDFALASVGIDIGKEVFHLVGFDPDGKIVLRRKINTNRDNYAHGRLLFPRGSWKPQLWHIAMPLGGSRPPHQTRLFPMPPANHIWQGVAVDRFSGLFRRKATSAWQTAIAVAPTCQFKSSSAICLRGGDRTFHRST